MGNHAAISYENDISKCSFCKVVFTDNALTMRLAFCIKRHCLNWQYFTNLAYVCENALTTEENGVIMLS